MTTARFFSFVVAIISIAFIASRSLNYDSFSWNPNGVNQSNDLSSVGVDGSQASELRSDSLDNQFALANRKANSAQAKQSNATYTTKTTSGLEIEASGVKGHVYDLEYIKISELEATFDEQVKNHIWLMDKFVSFKAQVENRGDTAEFTLTYPQEIPRGAQLWHVNPETNKFTNVPFERHGKHSVVYSIRDGSELDVDGVANGVIDDPIGLGGPASITEDAILASNDIVTGDNFGNGVSTSGNYAIVGAPEENNGKGAAYIFEKQGSDWVQVKKLTDDSGSTGDSFGYMVAISGNVAAVAIPGLDHSGSDNRGEVQIFENTGNNDWILANSVRGSNVSDDDSFGFALDMSETNIIVGVNNEGKDHPGAAYIYEKVSTDWTEVGVVTGSAVLDGDAFGGSVAIYGNYAVVSAEFHWLTTQSNHVGRAYIYENKGDNDWVQVVQLSDPNETSDVHFGAEVEIFEDYVVVSSTGQGTGGTTGAAYVFENQGDNDWDNVATLDASDGAEYDYFGDGLDISGKYIVVSSPGEYEPQAGDNEEALRPGKAYVFENMGNNNWTEIHKLTGSNSGDVDRFGFPVSCSNEHIIVGARSNDANGTNAGQAYIYSIVCPPPTKEWLTMSELEVDFTNNGSVVSIDDGFNLPNPSFDGVDDDLDFGGPLFSTGARHSFSMWLRFNSSTSGELHYIADQADSVFSKQQFYISKNSDDKLFFATYSGKSSPHSYYFVKSSVTIADNQWHHCVFTMNVDDPKIYVDGVDVTVFNNSGGDGFEGIGGTLQNFHLGNIIPASNTFGKFDLSRFKYWNGTELDAHCALHEYETESELLGTVPAPTDTWLTMTELQAGFTETGSIATVTDDFGNQNASFDGTNDDLDFDAPFFSSGAKHSFSMWLKFDHSTSGQTEYVITQAGSTFANQQFYVSKAADDKIFYALYGGVSSPHSYYFVKSSVTVADNQWHHYVFTMDVNEPKIYIDGVDLTVYNNSGGQGFRGINGTLQDLHIGNALPDTAVYGNFAMARLKRWVGIELNADSAQLEYFNEGGVGGFCPSPTEEWLTMSALQTDFTETGSIGLTNDDYGNTNPSFDGSDDDLDYDAPFFSTGAKHTMAMWLKFDESASGNTEYVIVQGDSALNKRQFAISKGTDDKMFFALYGGFSSPDSYYFVKSSVTVDDGNWHHYVFTMDLDDPKIYIDGSDVTVFNNSGGNGFQGINGILQDAHIGNALPGTSSYGEFELARLKIWNGLEFTSSCVTMEYVAEVDAQVGPTLLYWPTFSDLQNDFTETGSIGTITDDYSTQSASFDGTDDDFDYEAPFFSSGARHSLSMWLKFDTNTDGETEYVIRQGGSTSVTRQFAISKSSDNKIFFALYGGISSPDSYYFVKSSTTVADGTWRHYVFTMDVDDPKIYINGVDVTVFNNSGGTGFQGINGTIQDAHIGNELPAASNYGEFQLARLKVWALKEMSSSEALDEYNDEVAAQP